MTISGTIGQILFWGTVLGVSWFICAFCFLLLLLWWWGRDRYGGQL